MNRADRTLWRGTAFTLALGLASLLLPGRAPAQEKEEARQAQEKPPDETPVITAPKRFLPAAGELILLEIGPWAFNRYVTKEDFAYISWETELSRIPAGPPHSIRVADFSRLRRGPKTGVGGPPLKPKSQPSC